MKQKHISILTTNETYLYNLLLYAPKFYENSKEFVFHIFVDDRKTSLLYAKLLLDLTTRGWKNVEIHSGKEVIAHFNNIWRQSEESLLWTYPLSLKLLNFSYLFDKFDADKVLYLDDDCLLLGSVSHLFENYNFLFKFEPYGRFDINQSDQRELFAEYERIFDIHVEQSEYNLNTINAGTSLISNTWKFTAFVRKFFESRLLDYVNRHADKFKYAFYIEQKFITFFFQWLCQQKADAFLDRYNEANFVSLYQEREQVSLNASFMHQFVSSSIVHYACKTPELKLDFLRAFEKFYLHPPSNKL